MNTPRPAPIVVSTGRGVGNGTICCGVVLLILMQLAGFIGTIIYWVNAINDIRTRI